LEFSGGTTGCGGIVRKTLVTLRCGQEQTLMQEKSPCEYELKISSRKFCTETLVDCMIPTQRGFLDFSDVPELNFNNRVRLNICRALDYPVRIFVVLLLPFYIYSFFSFILFYFYLLLFFFIFIFIFIFIYLFIF
jgi:hypothetical protein